MPATVISPTTSTPPIHNPPRPAARGGDARGFARPRVPTTPARGGGAGQPAPARAATWRNPTPGAGGRAPVRAAAGNNGATGVSRGAPQPQKAEHDILFQKFFKSVGPRTYAAQVKRARNGNHYLVITEGQRDDKTGDVRKSRVFIYSEDFVEFFRLVKSAAEFIKGHPVPADVSQRQANRWSRESQRK